MRLKTFQAKSMHDALKQVRDTLGDDAIIVSTREEQSGWVRVTAAVEQMPEKAPPRVAAPELDEDTVIEIITDALLKHRVPGSVIDKIIATAIIVNNSDPQKTLARALQETFVFRDAAPQVTGKPLLLAGPPGAGKTLMTAKLAAQAVMNGQNPAVITTDIARAGGIEQLSAFLNILDLPLHQAEDHKSLQDVLAQVKGHAPVIIDTGGLNPFDPQEMKFLARLMAVTDMDPALVLPAGLDAEESAEMAMTFEVLGIRKLIPTRLDFARRLGGILCAADKAGLALCESSQTPQVANGITILSPQKLAELMMPHVPTAAQVKAKRGKA